MKNIVSLLVVLMVVLLSTCFAQDGITIPTEKKYSYSASQLPAADAFGKLEKLTGIKFAVESNVKTIVTLSINDSTLDSIVQAICKTIKADYRKLYISKNSKLSSQPDRLASTCRLMIGMGFEDIAIVDASNNKTAVFFSDKPTVKQSSDLFLNKSDIITVYLISDDGLAAIKTEKEKESTKVDKYIQESKKLLEDFMKMTPEEKEQTMMESLNMYENVDPSVMSNMMQSLMNVDPDRLKEITQRQTQMLFDMPQEQRRAMLRLNMQASMSFTPEQIQTLMEDQRAIMEELKNKQN